jgi:hypothetical protein
LLGEKYVYCFAYTIYDFALVEIVYVFVYYVENPASYSSIGGIYGYGYCYY